jgi:hypothetical protein
MREATAQIGRLRGVTWAWRPEAPAEAHAMPGMGIIAQEVDAIFPHLIERGEDGIMRVDYDGLFAPVAAAIGELRGRLLALARTEGTEVDPEGDAERVSRAARGARGTDLDVEQVEKVFPELVLTDENGDKTIAYHALIGPLIEAVKELDTRLSELERRQPS